MRVFGKCSNSSGTAANPAALCAYVADQGLPLREVLLDGGSRLGPAIGSRGSPTNLFYDQGGR